MGSDTAVRLMYTGSRNHGQSVSLIMQFVLFHFLFSYGNYSVFSFFLLFFCVSDPGISFQKSTANVNLHGCDSGLR